MRLNDSFESLLRLIGTHISLATPYNCCFNMFMLSDHDKVIIEEIVTRVVERTVDNRVDRVENKIDKVLKIVSSSNQEHTLTKIKVNNLEKRVKKVEVKLKIKSPTSTSVLV